MYRIRFAPHKANFKITPQELQCMRVYSEDINLIHQFLYQHNFDINNSPIEMVSDEHANEDALDRYSLKIRKFQSNEDKQIHEVATSDHLMELAVDYVTNELGTFLLFGPTIIRKDIQVIQIASDILESLPCTQILDHLLMDDDSVGDPYDTSWMIVSKTLEEFAASKDWDNCDLSYLYEMIDRECDNDIMPITLEAYVKSFVFSVLKG